MSGWSRGYLIWVVCCVSIGCGSRATISGKVSYTGKTVASGMVAIIASDGKAHYGDIQNDGSYSIPAVVIGDARFAVSSPNLAQPPLGGGRGKLAVDPTKPTKVVAPPEAPNFDASKWFAIPAEFGDPDRSGLKFNLLGGSNVIDLPLTVPPTQPKL